MMSHRSPREVFESHLNLAQEGRFKEDITQNYASDCVVLTRKGVFRGHAGLTKLAVVLSRELPDAQFSYDAKEIEGKVAFLGWSAECASVRVSDGADSFVIRDGLIRAQTIHYTLTVQGPSSIAVAEAAGEDREGIAS